jgi:ribosomal protein L20
MGSILDKDLIRKALIEYTVSDPEYISSLLEDIKQQIAEINRKKLENIVNEDFTEYDSVFKALA